MRPHKYDPDTMNDKILELGKVGGSYAEMCAEIGIGKSTGYDWMNPDHASYDAEFSEVMAIAKSLSQAWWEKQGRIGIRDKDINATLFNKQISGRFPEDWRDSQSVDHTSKGQQVGIAFAGFAVPESDGDNR